jgi:hypothetical protein
MAGRVVPPAPAPPAGGNEDDNGAGGVMPFGAGDDDDEDDNAQSGTAVVQPTAPAAPVMTAAAPVAVVRQAPAAIPPTAHVTGPPYSPPTMVGARGNALWRRPTRLATWYTNSVLPGLWDVMAGRRKTIWSHIGRIEETSDGMPRPQPCLRCRNAGYACLVYTPNAAAEYAGSQPHPSTKCSRCRNVDGLCL